MKDDDAYRRGDATRRMLVDVGGYRSMLSIALRKEVAGRAGALPEPPGPIIVYSIVDVRAALLPSGRRARRP